MKTTPLKYQIFSILCLLSSTVSYGKIGFLNKISSSLDQSGGGFSFVPIYLDQIFTINGSSLFGSNFIRLLSAEPFEASQMDVAEQVEV